MSNLEKLKIGIIGCGNLGESILRGLISNNKIKNNNIYASKTKIDPLLKYNKQEINITKSNIEVCSNSDLLLICVKPFRTQEVLEEINKHLDNKILVSVATGYTLKSLNDNVKKEIDIYRTSPNISISIGQSMTCISKSKNTSEKNDLIVKDFFSLFGRVSFIKESLMDAATVICASGTAFALRYLRAVMQGSVDIGFNAQQAQELGAQTIKGAMDLILQNESHPEAEIDKVTTPKGCTIAGLNEMELNGFSSATINGIIESFEKVKSMKN